MRMIIFIFLCSTLSFANEDLFKKEASVLSQSLKLNLMKNVSNKMTKNGAESAVEFCHANIKEMAKSAAKDYLMKFEFGRTSDRLRNSNNRADSWMMPFIEKFKSSKSGDMKAVVHILPDGKKILLDPIYVQPLCLKCHGEDVDSKVRKKILSLYPSDEAVNYRLGDFRGFIWIKEK